MKKKLKTIGALVLSLSIIFGFSMTAQAASGGVNVNVTKQTLLGTFQYPEAGHRLTIEISHIPWRLQGQITKTQLNDVC